MEKNSPTTPPALNGGISPPEETMSARSIKDCVNIIKGTQVVVEAMDGLLWTGILKEVSDQFEVELSFAQKLPVSEDSEFILSSKNALRSLKLKATRVSGDYLAGGGAKKRPEEQVFRTDAEIGENGGREEEGGDEEEEEEQLDSSDKEFQEWDGGDEELEREGGEENGGAKEEEEAGKEGWRSARRAEKTGPGGPGWSVDDMFLANRDKCVGESSFDENLTQYSNVEVGDCSKEDLERAAEIARQIEQNPMSRRHAQLENDDEERDLDKMTDFSREPEAAKKEVETRASDGQQQEPQEEEKQQQQSQSQQSASSESSPTSAGGKSPTAVSATAAAEGFETVRRNKAQKNYQRSQQSQHQPQSQQLPSSSPSPFQQQSAGTGAPHQTHYGSTFGASRRTMPPSREEQQQPFQQQGGYGRGPRNSYGGERRFGADNRREGRLPQNQQQQQQGGGGFSGSYGGGAQQGQGGQGQRGPTSFYNRHSTGGAGAAGAERHQQQQSWQSQRAGDGRRGGAQFHRSDNAGGGAGAGYQPQQQQYRHRDGREVATGGGSRTGSSSATTTTHSRQGSSSAESFSTGHHHSAGPRKWVPQQTQGAIAMPGGNQLMGQTSVGAAEQQQSPLAREDQQQMGEGDGGTRAGAAEARTPTKSAEEQQQRQIEAEKRDQSQQQGPVAVTDSAPPLGPPAGGQAEGGETERRAGEATLADERQSGTSTPSTAAAEDKNRKSASDFKFNPDAQPFVPKPRELSQLGSSAAIPTAAMVPSSFAPLLSSQMPAGTTYVQIPPAGAVQIPGAAQMQHGLPPPNLMYNNAAVVFHHHQQQQQAAAAAAAAAAGFVPTASALYYPAGTAAGHPAGLLLQQGAGGQTATTVLVHHPQHGAQQFMAAAMEQQNLQHGSSHHHQLQHQHSRDTPTSGGLPVLSASHSQQALIDATTGAPIVQFHGGTAAAIPIGVGPPNAAALPLMNLQHVPPPSVPPTSQQQPAGIVQIPPPSSSANGGVLPMMAAYHQQQHFMAHQQQQPPPLPPAHSRSSSVQPGGQQHFQPTAAVNLNMQQQHTAPVQSVPVTATAAAVFYAAGHAAHSQPYLAQPPHQQQQQLIQQPAMAHFTAQMPYYIHPQTAAGQAMIQNLAAVNSSSSVMSHQQQQMGPHSAHTAILPLPPTTSSLHSGHGTSRQ